MAHHKRRKPKSRRAGCLMCKPWKHQRGSNGEEKQKVSVRRVIQRMRDE